MQPFKKKSYLREGVLGQEHWKSHVFQVFKTIELEDAHVFRKFFKFFLIMTSFFGRGMPLHAFKWKIEVLSSL